MQVHAVDNDVVDDVRKFKTALAQTLMSKALATRDPNRGSFLYLLATFVSDFKVVKSNIPMILGMDGDTLYVGALYDKYLENVARKKPEDVVKVKAFMILHEALHRMFGHDVRMKLAGDKTLFNIVADLYVNTFLERQVGLTGFEGIVTLRNLSNFIVQHFGTELTREQREAIEKLGEYEVENKVSVEQVYNTLIMLPKHIVESVKEKFGSGKFYGKDLGAGNQGGQQSSEQEQGQSEGWGDSTGKDKQSGQKQGQQQAGNEPGSKNVGGEAGNEKDTVNIGEEAAKGSQLSRKLDDVADRLREIAERIHRASGEYQALRRLTEGKNAGTAPGIMEYVEYKQVSNLLLQVYRLFMRDVGETLTEPRVSFEKFDEEAYWLPAREKERRRTVLALVDASPSVPRRHLSLFLSCVVNSVNAFDIEYRLVVFGTGVLDEKTISTENVYGEIQRVPRGYGTHWDKTVAEKIREATASGVRLIQVLSDFWIVVSNEAEQAIMEFRNTGGKIACYSSSGAFLGFCDMKNTLPTVPEH